jgi:hypothetical protein
MSDKLNPQFYRLYVDDCLATQWSTKHTMSKAIHTSLNGRDHRATAGLEGIKGNFPMDEAVIECASISAPGETLNK